MRETLKELLGTDWLEKKLRYQEHVNRVIAMKLTPEDRVAIGELLDLETNESVGGTLTGIMETEPHNAYAEALVRALDASEPWKRHYAMRALLRGGYKGAVELLLSKPAVQDAMEDGLPWELGSRVGSLAENQREVLREAFCRRFMPLPTLDGLTRPWLQMLVDIPGTNDRVVKIMLALWAKHDSSVDQLAILEAMVSGDDPRYEPVFKEAAQSGIKDLRDLGRLGLKILAGEVSLDDFKEEPAEPKKAKKRKKKR